MTHIQNARITDATIQFERGFALTAWIHVEMESGNQGFGGFVMGGNPFDENVVCAKHQNQKNLAADVIGGFMAIADVESWDKMKGKVIRVEHETSGWNGPILAIGHAFKDRWYRPKERMALLTGRTDD